MFRAGYPLSYLKWGHQDLFRFILFILFYILSHTHYFIIYVYIYEYGDSMQRLYSAETAETTHTYTSVSTRRNVDGIELSRRSQSPCLAHPPAVGNSPGVELEVSGNGVDVGRPRGAESTVHLHPSPLDMTPRS